MKTSTKKIRGNGAPRRTRGGAKLGGWRPGSGRPPKPDRDQWGKVTCKLKRDTIERLRNSATAPGEEQTVYFGEYLQWHLEQYPPLDWMTWQAFLAVPQRRVAPSIKQKRLSRAERAEQRAMLKELKDAIAARKK
jgi:hypothetical protein